MTTDEMRIDLLRTTFRYGRVNMGIRLGNITHGEFTALQMVHIYMKRNPDASGIGVSELARCSFMSPPAMSRTLKSIEEKGLAERMIDSKNRRKTYVRLTQARRTGPAVRLGGIHRVYQPGDGGDGGRKNGCVPCLVEGAGRHHGEKHRNGFGESFLERAPELWKSNFRDVFEGMAQKEQQKGEIGKNVEIV